MTYNGAHGFGADEDYPDWVVAANNGFRVWQVIDPAKGRIGSTNWSYEWTPGVNASKCQSSYPQWLDHSKCRAELHPDDWKHTPECPQKPICEYPTANCGCGFYAYYAREYWTGGGFIPWPIQSHIPASRMYVAGLIEGYGRCVLGSKGFRASRAVVIAFALPALRNLSGHSAATFNAETADPGEQELVRNGLRERFPNVPIFDSAEQMLTVLPLAGRP